MQGVSLTSRAAAFAVAAGALVFILSLIVGGPLDDIGRIGQALIVGILCGTLSWASAIRTISSIALAIDRATDRLRSAAHGDLQSPMPPEVGQELPDLAKAAQSLLSQVRANLDHIQALALFDQVTGLANRASFCRQVERLLPGQCDIPSSGALFFIDLDGFKSVNDTLGHAAGDRLLAQVAGRLRDVVAAQRTAGMGDAVIGRLAGDEFTVYFPSVPDEDAPPRIARAIQFALGERFDLDGQHVDLGASIGIARHPQHGDTLSTLLRSADIAMYHAKHEGRGRTEMFTAELALVAADRAELERDLLLALERGELLLEFQPQIDIALGRAVSAEALVRWAHPERGIILPGQFVPVAEESGAIVGLGQWVMDKVCETAARWAREGIEQRVAINISTRELAQPDFARRLEEAMGRHGTAGTMLELELTESLAMDMNGRVFDQLNDLRAKGVRVSIDDFGTGYSNLSRLKALPVDCVKIDRSLISDISTSPQTRTICAAVVGLVQGLGMDVAIEGVETQVQLDILRVIGCTRFQGYHLARPTSEPDYLARFGPREEELLRSG